MISLTEFAELLGQKPKDFSAEVQKTISTEFPDFKKLDKQKQENIKNTVLNRL
jgi:predicted HTH domain antitoxin